MVKLLVERGVLIPTHKRRKVKRHCIASCCTRDGYTVQKNDNTPEEGSTSGGTYHHPYATSPLVELLLARGANKRPFATRTR
mmetsp:Transcript_3711/g.4187  ORF Transcript_3711/g.4187 Transcript_3711/m.4187 type:complete len:82 (-) Transcript_3711:121-366(-)